MPNPRERGPRWKRALKWTALSLFGLILLLAIAGFSYNQIEQYIDARRFPQQGRSVQLGPEFGNVSLNIDCSGQGSPTVILDSGGGIPAIGWKHIQPEVAKFTHVCSYDRAGYGWSTAGPMPRTSSEAARELHALLAAAGEKPPYILVGHSLGGFNIRVFNGFYPNEVAGMVLVDGSSEDSARAQRSKPSPAFAELLKKQEAEFKWQKRLAPFRIYLGIARLMDNDAVPPYLSVDDWKEMRYLELQMKFYSAAWSELDSFAASANQVRATGNLGDKPLIVLTAAKVVPPPRGLPQKEFDDIQNKWVNDLQVRQAHLSTYGKQIILRDSSHLVPFEKPAAVISAIQEVWTSATRVKSPLAETSH
jgi:pimeloyl-ACP methyl ester carboxylesterase